MKDDRDPERLLAKGAGTPAPLRTVLASAEADSPSAQDLARLAATLASVLPASSAAAHAPEAAAGAATLSAAAGAAKSAWKLKLLLSLATGTLAVSGATYYASRAREPEIEPVRRGVVLPPPPRVVPVATTAETAPSAMPSAKPESAARTKRMPTPAATRERAPSISETQLLSDAVGALTRGDAGSALALTEQHRRLFPAGTYGEEFERIAVEALLRLGERAAAEARAQAFFRRFPASAHRARLEQLLRHRASGAK